MRTTLRTALTVALLGAVAPGCKETTFAMAPDASLPFVQGQVTATLSDDGNGSYTVSVEHLGDPGKLNPLAKTYVVWIVPRTEDKPIQNVGALRVDSRYSGSYTFTSTFREFDISITPEERADITKPTGRDVLKATVSMVPRKPAQPPTMSAATAPPAKAP